MEETLGGANQSAELAVTQPPAEAPVTTQDAPSEPQGIKVKYNKEERVIGYDEAPDWIQKGLNYDKVQERATQAEAQAKQLDRVAKFYGFDSPDKYLQALEQAERDKQIEEEAARLGVDESVVLQHLQPLRQEVNDLKAHKEELETLKQSLTVQKQLVDLRGKYPDFDQYGPKIAEMVQTKGYDLEDAYILASHQEKVAQIARETEATTIRNLQQNATTTPGSLGAEGPDENTGYLAMTPTQRKAFRESVLRGTAN